MKLPWKQLGALLLILTIGAASIGPPPSRGGQARRARGGSWLAHQPSVRKVVSTGALRNPSYSASSAKRIAAVSQTAALVRVQYARRSGTAAGHVRWQLTMSHAGNLGTRSRGLAKSPPNFIVSSAALRLATRLLTHRYVQPVMCVVRLVREVS